MCKCKREQSVRMFTFKATCADEKHTVHCIDQQNAINVICIYTCHTPLPPHEGALTWTPRTFVTHQLITDSIPASHCEGCVLQRSHTTAACIIEAVSFQETPNASFECDLLSEPIASWTGPTHTWRFLFHQYVLCRMCYLIQPPNAHILLKWDTDNIKKSSSHSCHVKSCSSSHDQWLGFCRL